jgi:hypothetical protein
MLAELTNIPTHTLIELLFVTMMGTVALTATDITEIDQLQCELKRRREDPRWMLESVN